MVRIFYCTYVANYITHRGLSVSIGGSEIVSVRVAEGTLEEKLKEWLDKVCKEKKGTSGEFILGDVKVINPEDFKNYKEKKKPISKSVKEVCRSEYVKRKKTY